MKFRNLVLSVNGVKVFFVFSVVFVFFLLLLLLFYGEIDGVI